ncbi:hypothetical protein LguiA_030719 [Lonicera macranthoides]
MPSPSQLHGPPELRRSWHLPAPVMPAPPLPPPPPPPPPPPNWTVPVPDEKPRYTGKIPMGFTENNSLTYLATGNPCVDFFFHIVPNTPTNDLIQRLSSAWDHDQLTTLKLICNLRGVRGTGKSDKENFYTAAIWLHNFHPKTLASNVSVFAEFGCFKDLLEILYRILEGPLVRAQAKKELENRKNGRTRTMRFRGRPRKRGQKISKGKFGRKLALLKKRELRARVPREERIKENMVKVNEEKSTARVLRKEKELAKANKAMEKYKGDSDYRFLHDQISSVFAENLKLDIQRLNSNETKKISLAAKWCPKIDSAYDKATLIYESIARKVFPKEDYVEYEGIKEGYYAYRVRDRLRKEVLVPLRKVLQLPEVYMSAKQWDALPYNRVASVAMKNYKEIFLLHDGNRFEEYLEDVKRGKATIAAGALLPHQIIKSLGDGDDGKVAELQWARMVDDVAKLGKLNNCIAVCDVSASMSGTAIRVCVALGLLISELSEEPWKGNVITFSENPELHKVKGDSLLEKTSFVYGMEWGGNTDFQKVFDRILEIATTGNLNEDQMIKRIFVFSDMEFDEACCHYPDYGCDSSEDSDLEGLKAEKARSKGWETDYEVIQRKFREKGFNNVPQIVFWNLRPSSATPVTAQQKGVALVSGFSKNMVTVFLEEGGLENFNPVAVMEKSISGELYQKLAVLD